MKEKPKVGIIIPTFSHFEYAAKTIRTATYDPWAVAIVVDDASPDWNPDGLKGIGNGHLAGLQQSIGKDRVHIYRFDQNGGLTRSWNQGLKMARELECDYAVAANSDLIFSLNWFRGMVHALEEYHLLGPVTNAPGTEEAQDVTRWYPDYLLDDDENVVHKIGFRLLERHDDDVVPGTINGFCMAAKTEVWWANAYDAEHVFKPRNDFNSRGQPNPTPLMTLNEYELQRRWQAAGLKTGFCPGSFVFHYRSVSRGDKFKRGNWYRMGQ